jgi:hypothetical protein
MTRIRSAGVLGGALAAALMLVTTSARGQAAAATPAASSSPRVVAASSHAPGTPHRAGLGDRVTVTVHGVQGLLAQTGGDCNRILLFLGGLAIKGLPPEACDPQKGQFRFFLHREETPGEADPADFAWHALLGKPLHFQRQISVSVGATDDTPLPTDVDEFQFEILPPVAFYGFLAALVAAAALFVRLARRTDMLRNMRAVPAPGRRRPYSLARFQMAFWFFLVVAAYVFIWMITGELDTVTPSILALIGIGSGTALGAALIDANAPPNAGAERGSSTSFLTDVLSSDDGVSFHRFQMFVWTVVLGVIFCASVYRTLAMPEFSITLLGLMGISSGTYLGFKFPEQNATKSGSGEDAPAAG